MATRIFIGTSGWSYDHWAGEFYPSGLPHRAWFSYYVTRFPTVEINNTFYRLPSEKTMRGWRAQAPSGFRFALKGSRFITHVRRLLNSDDPVSRFMERAELLGEALAVVLWQLPPQLKPDPARLDQFLASLPHTARHAVEFRDQGWLRDDVFTVLRRHNVAHVNVSSDDMPADLTPTADFVYVRLHGLSAEHNAYSVTALEPWARFLAEQRDAGRDAYVYFNNDMGGHAPRDACRLERMLSSPETP